MKVLFTYEYQCKEAYGDDEWKESITLFKDSDEAAKAAGIHMAMSWRNGWKVIYRLVRIEQL